MLTPTLLSLIALSAAAPLDAHFPPAYGTTSVSPSEPTYSISPAIPSPSPTATLAPVCPVAPTPTGDYIWKISKFYARKLDGKNVSSVAFNISATNTGTLNFECAASADPIKDKTLYKCGENSFIYFAWQDETGGLTLKQGESDDTAQIGTTTVPTYCRAGGSGLNDLICQGVADAYVTLVKYPVDVSE